MSDSEDRDLLFEQRYGGSHVIASFEGEYGFLSNFYPSPILLPYDESAGGVTSFNYPTVEHRFQAMKATAAADHLSVACASTPGAAKRRGRTIDLRPDWEDVKVDVMRAALEAKFAHGSDLATRLIETHPSRLVEGNTWGDRVWGAEWVEGLGWVGGNMLGIMLMSRRNTLRYAVLASVVSDTEVL